MYVAAIRTAESEDAYLDAVRKRKGPALKMTVPMRRTLALPAFRTLPGAIFLRQAMVPNQLQIVRNVLMPQGKGTLLFRRTCRYGPATVWQRYQPFRIRMQTSCSRISPPWRCNRRPSVQRYSRSVASSLTTIEGFTFVCFSTTLVVSESLVGKEDGVPAHNVTVDLGKKKPLVSRQRI